MLFGKKFALIAINALLLSSSLGSNLNPSLVAWLTASNEAGIEVQQSETLLAGDVRSLDGSGNNLQNPEWGSANEQFLRYSAVAYADGISSPAGEDRPSARTISNAFAASPEDGLLSDRDLTALVYAWGQFIDHDITLTKAASPSEVFPIIVPSGDEWFDPAGTGTVTIPVSRSNYDTTTGTSAGNPREQVNSISAFLDGSMVYGSDTERANALRTFSDGLMETSAGELLPFNDSGLANDNDAHIFPANELFLGGDVRANENPDLLSLQVLFVREHNRIATAAALDNPNWSDEDLYQFARSIVIAEIQKITYDEFLPAILGRNALPAYQGYQADVNPGIAIEFSTAAYRFGHSLLGDDVEFLDNDGNEIREALDLQESFFNPAILSETGIDPVLKYLASDNAQEVDTMAVDAVRNFLFGEPGQGGFDLAALNIQRGRDHGLADYNSVRVAYGLQPVTDFSQITSDPAMQAKLAALYGNVDNIDLWVGGLAEDHLANSSLGITFTTILVDQFTRLRDGDRFWYQTALTADLQQIVERTSLADVIKNNTDLTNLQENVFFFNEDETVAENDAGAGGNEGDAPSQAAQPQGNRGNNPPQQNGNGRPPGNQEGHPPGNRGDGPPDNRDNRPPRNP